MTRAFDVCVVGSANLDLVATTDRLPGPGESVLGFEYAEHAGGKGLNQAVAAARAGASTTFCAAVGNDNAGTLLRQVMHDDGIDDSAVQVVTGVPTGRALIGVSSTAENSIIVVPGANALLQAGHVSTIAAAASVLLVQLEVPIAAVHATLIAARAAGATTILNPAPAARLSEHTLSLCDVVIPNEHEVEIVGGVDALLRLGAHAVVVTLGSRGAELHLRDGSIAKIPAFEVDAVDTTAAGDAFCGAFAAATARGDDLERALRFAAAAGALATTRAGAVPSLPNLPTIEDLLSAAG